MTVQSNSTTFRSEHKISESSNKWEVCGLMSLLIIVRSVSAHSITTHVLIALHSASISPDGLTLLSVGDSSKVYLHQIKGGSQISFSPIATLTLPPANLSPFMYPSSSLAASFSTAFSSDGSKYAVASQEGVLVVWDVRCTKPLRVFQTDKTRLPASSGNGGATGWLSDDFGDWTRGTGRAPGWSVRNVKFGGSAKEVMTFTEVCTRQLAIVAGHNTNLLSAHFPTARCGCSNI